MCQCVAASPESCIEQRYDVSSTFVAIVGACSCRCHYAANGAQLPTESWLRKRQRSINRKVVKLVPEENQQ